MHCFSVINVKKGKEKDKKVALAKMDDAKAADGPPSGARQSAAWWPGGTKNINDLVLEL